MIKLKDLLRETKAKHIVLEAFKSNILRSLTQKWQGLDDQFFQWGASKGVQWDKIEDFQIDKTAKPKKKGLEIAVSGKKVTLPGKRKDYWGYHDVALDKDTLIGVILNGKPQYYTHGYRTSWGRGVDDKDKARIELNKKHNVKVGAGGDFSYETKEKWGLDVFGYRSLAAIASIPGVQFYHIDLSGDRDYMGAGEVRTLRLKARLGAITFQTATEFKKAQDERMKELLRKKVDDPQRIEAAVKKANAYGKQFVDVILGGKVNKKFNDIINRFAATGKRTNDEAATYELLDYLVGNLDLMYRRYGEYLDNVAKLAKEKKEKGKSFDPKYSNSYDIMTRTARTTLNVAKLLQGPDLRKLDNVY